MENELSFLRYIPRLYSTFLKGLNRRECIGRWVRRLVSKPDLEDSQSAGFSGYPPGNIRERNLHAMEVLNRLSLESSLWISWKPSRLGVPQDKFGNQWVIKSILACLFRISRLFYTVTEVYFEKFIDMECANMRKRRIHFLVSRLPTILPLVMIPRVFRELNGHFTSRPITYITGWGEFFKIMLVYECKNDSNYWSQDSCTKLLRVYLNVFFRTY